MSTIRIAPSLAAAPMAHLAHSVQELERAGAAALHFDVEDGSFIPMLTLGTRIIGELRPLTRLPFDVHLAMHNPEWILPGLKALGADWVSVHWEACPFPHRTLGLIRGLGLRAGLAFNPATPLPDLRYLRSSLDFLLILTNEPEYPHAPFLPEVLVKLHQGREMLRTPAWTGKWTAVSPPTTLPAPWPRARPSWCADALSSGMARLRGIWRRCGGRRVRKRHHLARSARLETHGRTGRMNERMGAGSLLKTDTLAD